VLARITGTNASDIDDAHQLIVTEIAKGEEAARIAAQKAAADKAAADALAASAPAPVKA
jgi:hypothetical protein